MDAAALRDGERATQGRRTAPEEPEPVPGARHASEDLEAQLAQWTEAAAQQELRAGLAQHSPKLGLVGAVAAEE